MLKYVWEMLALEEWGINYATSTLVHVRIEIQDMPNLYFINCILQGSGYAYGQKKF